MSTLTTHNVRSTVYLVCTMNTDKNEDVPILTLYHHIVVFLILIETLSFLIKKLQLKPGILISLLSSLQNQPL